MEDVFDVELNGSALMLISISSFYGIVSMISDVFNMLASFLNPI